MKIAKILLSFWIAVAIIELGVIVWGYDRYNRMVYSYETDIGVLNFVNESNQDEINKCRGTPRQKFMRLLHMQKCERV